MISLHILGTFTWMAAVTSLAAGTCQPGWFTYEKMRTMQNAVNRSDDGVNLETCKQTCLADDSCVAVEYDRSSSQRKRCWHYHDRRKLTAFIKNDLTDLYVRNKCEESYECRIDIGPCEEECRDVCSCTLGFKLDAEGQSCRNTSDCAIGFEKVGSSCSDIDECLHPEKHDCKHLCINLPGSYKCDCKEGFKSTENNDCDRICEPEWFTYKNMRTTEGPLKHTTGVDEETCKETCLNDSSCVAVQYDQRNSRQSKCWFYTDRRRLLGFVKSSLTDLFVQHKCEDPYECRTDIGSCEEECYDVCNCNVGFTLHPQKQSCIDIDECQSDNLNNCTKGIMTCLNQRGSYVCQCSEGFEKDGSHCVDINECSDPKLHDCSQQCINLPGTYTCDCAKGFKSTEDNDCEKEWHASKGSEKEDFQHWPITGVTIAIVVVVALIVLFYCAHRHKQFSIRRRDTETSNTMQFSNLEARTTIDITSKGAEGLSAVENGYSRDPSGGIENPTYAAMHGEKGMDIRAYETIDPPKVDKIEANPYESLEKY